MKLHQAVVLVRNRLKAARPDLNDAFNINLMTADFHPLPAICARWCKIERYREEKLCGS
jgi:hypothetical protein